MATGLGIDLGAAAIKVVRLRRSGANWQVLRAARVPDPNPPPKAPAKPSDPLPEFAKKMIAAGKTTAGLYGKNVVVVGHSEIVGKPLELLFLDHFCTVTVCHIATKNLAEKTRQADILCVAVGKPGLIKGEMVKPGGVVIDIGINRVPDIGPDGKQLLNKKGKPAMKTVGDVDYAKAAEVAGWITPVPGGVGPMTVAMLLKNVVEAAKA